MGIGQVMIPEDELLAMPEDQFAGMLTVFELRFKAARLGLKVVEDHLTATSSRLTAIQATASAMPPGIVKQGMEKVVEHIEAALSVMRGLLEKDQ